MKHYYCLAHKKYILSCLVDFQGPETIKFILGIIEMIYFFMFCPNEETFKFFFNCSSYPHFLLVIFWNPTVFTESIVSKELYLELKMTLTQLVILGTFNV